MHQVAGQERELDVTPPGWTPPNPDEMTAILDLLAFTPHPNDPNVQANILRQMSRFGIRKGIFAGMMLGLTMRFDRLSVFVLELDGFAYRPLVAQARQLLAALREQQMLARHHETDTYEDARKRMLAGAQRAMASVKSPFTLEHPPEPKPAEVDCADAD